MKYADSGVNIDAATRALAQKKLKKNNKKMLRMN